MADSGSSLVSLAILPVVRASESQAESIPQRSLIDVGRADGTSIPLLVGSSVGQEGRHVRRFRDERRNDVP